MTAKCITFPMNNHPRVRLRPEPVIQAEIDDWKLKLSAHMAVMPGPYDPARREWAEEKDRLRGKIGLLEGELANRWRVVG